MTLTLCQHSVFAEKLQMQPLYPCPVLYSFKTSLGGKKKLFLIFISLLLFIV